MNYINDVLTEDTVEGFTWGYLAANYDNPQPVPPFHTEMWKLCCSDEQKVAIAAPRKHAKSTAITHAFIMTAVLTRVKSFVLLVSNTEAQAAEFLISIKTELETNERLKKDWGVKRLLKDTETNIICELKDGHKFRIQAKG